MKVLSIYLPLLLFFVPLCWLGLLSVLLSSYLMSFLCRSLQLTINPFASVHMTILIYFTFIFSSVFSLHVKVASLKMQVCYPQIHSFWFEIWCCPLSTMNLLFQAPSTFLFITHICFFSLTVIGLLGSSLWFLRQIVLLDYFRDNLVLQYCSNDPTLCLSFLFIGS